VAVECGRADLLAHDIPAGVRADAADRVQEVAPPPSHPPSYKCLVVSKTPSLLRVGRCFLGGGGNGDIFFNFCEFRFFRSFSRAIYLFGFRSALVSSPGEPVACISHIVICAPPSVLHLWCGDVAAASVDLIHSAGKLQTQTP